MRKKKSLPFRRVLSGSIQGPSRTPPICRGGDPAGGLEELERWTFCGCGIRRLTIPKSVKRVCSCAIWNCRSLEVIEVEGEGTVLEDLIAYRCDGYKLVTRGNRPIDDICRATVGAFLQRKEAPVPEGFQETAQFRMLAQRCADGDSDAMWAMGDHFTGLGAQPFYELAANFWRYRAYQRGSSDAKAWFRHWDRGNWRAADAGH